jgi:hypothetical protein
MPNLPVTAARMLVRMAYHQRLLILCVFTCVLEHTDEAGDNV